MKKMMILSLTSLMAGGLLFGNTPVQTKTVKTTCAPTSCAPSECPPDCCERPCQTASPNQQSTKDALPEGKKTAPGETASTEGVIKCDPRECESPEREVSRQG